MTQRSDAELVVKAAQLARSSPREWSEFLEEIRKHTDRVKDEMVSSTSDTLLVNQGRARESAALLKLYEGCLPESDKIVASRK